MSQETSAGEEPNMEDILSSIRRIISDDDKDAAGALEVDEDQDVMELDEEITEDAGDIFDAIEVEEEFSAEAIDDFDAIGDMDEDAFAEDITVDMDEDETNFEELEAEVEAEAEDDDFIPLHEDIDFADVDSDETEMTDEFVMEDEEQLEEENTFEAAPVANTVSNNVVHSSDAPNLMSQNTNQAVSAAFNQLASAIFTGQQRTIEDVIQELLRPMLKTWIDDNLPAIVERLVKEEIQRVSRGGR